MVDFVKNLEGVWSLLYFVLYLVLATAYINFLSILATGLIAKPFVSNAITKRIIASGMDVDKMAYIYKPFFKKAVFVSNYAAKFKVQEVSKTVCLWTETVILAAGGFLAGCFGIPLIGWSFSGRGWLGLIVFMAADFLAIALIGQRWW